MGKTFLEMERNWIIDFCSYTVFLEIGPQSVARFGGYGVLIVNVIVPVAAVFIDGLGKLQKVAFHSFGFGKILIVKRRSSLFAFSTIHPGI